MRRNISSKYLVSLARLSSISSARFKTSRCLDSAKLSTTTATMRFSTPNTRVNKDPMKMMAVAGYCWMTGTATSPQLSPAITVLKSKRLACITEEVASRHHSQSAKRPCCWLRCKTSGYIHSTMSIAQMVMTMKQNTKDHSSALKHVAAIRTNFWSSRKVLVLRKSRVNRKIRISRKAREMPMDATTVPRPNASKIISRYPQAMTATSTNTTQSLNRPLPLITKRMNTSRV
mmetsp:Transcript_4301/g.10338  ORF Transcript_4301/g.10338 Transcript_4301/m.10338 type:complete len:231 (-) Transcript_4301:412-1104(-)